MGVTVFDSNCEYIVPGISPVMRVIDENSIAATLINGGATGYMIYATNKGQLLVTQLGGPTGAYQNYIYPPTEISSIMKRCL